MQTSALSIPEIKSLIAQRASALDSAITPEFIDIHEDLYAVDRGTLIVQIVSKRSADGRAWTEKRLRFSQAIRDLLLENGDQRYPVLQFFAPEEWAGRND